jgi:hypothetical protein
MSTMAMLLQRVPAAWRNENALILAALVLSTAFLIAFCGVVSGVVRSAEERHQQPFGQAPDPTPQQAAQTSGRADLPG